ncbi:MAG: LysM peptidoglycan-binding domain-containing protein [Lachnospiraceae bacterium]
MMYNIKINSNKIMLTVGVIVFFSIFIIGGMRMVQADESIEYDKSFMSIEIENGDTLTSIAREYAVSEAEYTDYIAEVKSINNLKSDTIHAGCYLMIPVYEEVSSK